MSKRLDLKIGFFCNNRCKFCVQGDKRSRYGQKPFKQLEKEMKESLKAGCRNIVLTGGEPTLRSDFLDLVALAKKLGFKKIQIQTNGRRFAYYDFCRKTIEAGANEFAPAVHGHTAELHDSLTTAPGSFSQTITGIRNLKKLGQQVMTNTVITKPNYKRLPEIAELLTGLGVDQFQFAFVHISGTAAQNVETIVPQKSAIMPYVKKGLQIGIDAGIRVMTEAIPYCFMKGYEDYVVEKIIPDSRVHDADFVLDDYTEYRRNKGKLKGPKCPGCKYYKICEGPWKEYPEIFGWSEFTPQ